MTPGTLDEFGDICRVVYFERTPAISTTAVVFSAGGR